MLEILETLQHTARDIGHEKEDYYCLASVYQSARGKLHLQQELCRSLILRLLGNKGHQKMFESVSKVDKQVNKMNNFTRGYVRSPTLLGLAPQRWGVGVFGVFTATDLVMSVAGLGFLGEELHLDHNGLPLISEKVRVLGTGMSETE